MERYGTPGTSRLFIQVSSLVTLAYLDEGDTVLHAQGGHELLVHWLVAVLSQHAQQGLPFVQRLALQNIF